MSTPFSNKSFQKLFIAQCTSLIGTGVTTVALALLAWDLAKDQASMVLGIALALKMIAYVFFSPIISTYSNKFSRKKWLISLDIIRTILVLYLPFITEVWEIYIVIFLINLASSGFTPIFQSTIAHIIKNEEEYKKAISFSRLAYDLEQLLSPTIAAILLGFISFNILFTINSVTFIISAILISFSIIPYIKRNESKKPLLKESFSGIKKYFQTPQLKALFFAYIIVALSSAMIITNTVVFVSDIFKKEESFTAYAYSISGFGSMLIALLIIKLYKYISIRSIILLGSSTLTLALFIGYFISTWNEFLVLWFILGIGLSLIQVPVGVLIKQISTNENSFYFFSANFSLSHLCWMFTYPFLGYIGTIYNLNEIFLILFTISFISLLFVYRIYPK